MTNEYIAVPTTKQDNGLFAVNKAVIEAIATIAVEEMADAQVQQKTTFNAPVSCRISEKSISLSINIRIKHNVNIANTCAAVQQRINQALQQMLSLTCQDIDIKVVGLIF